MRLKPSAAPPSLARESPTGDTGDRELVSRPAARRGRPQKFGRPARVVAMALPEDVIRALERVDADLGWAVVKLLERADSSARARPEPDVELVHVATRRSLIVVNRAAMPPLPGVNMIPLHGNRAFLAFEPGSGLNELELAIIDGLAEPRLSHGERQVLVRLRAQLASWRRDRTLAFHTRAIVVVERAKRAGGRTPAGAGGHARR